MRLLAFVGAFVIAALAGCCTATQGTRAARPTIQDTEVFSAPFDKVWGAVVATLAEESYPIGVIDKSSGLITTQQVILLEGFLATVQAADSYIVRPPGEFGLSATFDRLRVMLNVFANPMDSLSTKVKVTAHFEGTFRTEGWRVCDSKGLLEKRMFQAIRAKL